MVVFVVYVCCSVFCVCVCVLCFIYIYIYMTSLPDVDWLHNTCTASRIGEDESSLFVIRRRFILYNIIIVLAIS